MSKEHLIGQIAVRPVLEEGEQPAPDEKRPEPGTAVSFDEELTAAKLKPEPVKNPVKPPVPRATVPGAAATPAAAGRRARGRRARDRRSGAAAPATAAPATAAPATAAPATAAPATAAPATTPPAAAAPRHGTAGHAPGGCGRAGSQACPPPLHRARRHQRRPARHRIGAAGDPAGRSAGAAAGRQGASDRARRGPRMDGG